MLYIFKREQYNRIVKDNGAIVLFAAQPFTTNLISSNIKNYRYNWYWIKNKTTGFGFANYQPMRKLKDVCVFYKKSPTYNPQGLQKRDIPHIKKRKAPNNNDDIYNGGGLSSGKEYISEYTNYPNHILEFKKETKSIHPTQKPVALLEYLIKTYTNEGETVLDNTMGSGSTGVACVNTNRRFIGIEKDKKYFEIAKNRIFKD